MIKKYRILGEKDEIMNGNDKIDFGNEKVWKILCKLAPPVMFAQLIQALYNIVDSLYIGRYSEEGLTALSILYPIQLLMIALAVGTGVGMNTYMARLNGLGEHKESKEVAGVGSVLAFIMWILFAVIGTIIMPGYARMSTSSDTVIELVITYGTIVCIFSIGLFMESIWTKVLQATGNMKVPMIAQVVGAIVNIVLDPIFIFGYLGMPEMGIKGAAIATVIGQMVAAIIVGIHGFYKPPKLSKFIPHIKHIYLDGIPNILMQSAYTIYILGLNLILQTFSDQAVTALGLYYKWQTFFFIPLGGLQTCIVPILSYNYATGAVDRCKKVLWNSFVFGFLFMMIGVICFEGIPTQMLQIFSKDQEVIQIGTRGFRLIGLSFIPMVISLIFPVFYQALGLGFKSMALTVIRTMVLFVPVGYLLSFIGLDYFWLTFPITETVTAIVGFLFYKDFLKKNPITA
ncbi:multi antimicrobial extrusion protein (Na(+)/drug antiporter), MATE family of MDR efflux pumps [Lachnospiraceae bacterium KM106-2]|nr:multi antimicrobial extrusion protein (Na(+)/drug antiporter), MATE family of MDR efflux pumps [Lachnospiraceae bacterium KM106-2]